MVRDDKLIRIAPTMKLYIEEERIKLAEQLKKETGLQSINIPFISFSQLLANKLRSGKGLIHYRIRKTGLNSGVLEFL